MSWIDKTRDDVYGGRRCGGEVAGIDDAAAGVRCVVTAGGLEVGSWR
jgi:hypothetical protein